MTSGANRPPTTKAGDSRLQVPTGGNSRTKTKTSTNGANHSKMIHTAMEATAKVVSEALAKVVSEALAKVALEALAILEAEVVSAKAAVEEVTAAEDTTNGMLSKNKTSTTGVNSLQTTSGINSSRATTTGRLQRTATPTTEEKPGKLPPPTMANRAKAALL